MELPRSRTAQTVDWGDLVRRHDRAVWLSIVALGIAPERARDLAQAAWTRLIEQVASGVVRELRMPGLVLAQARFLALDELRASRVERQRRAPDDALGQLAGASPEQLMIARERLSRAGEALARCAPREQHVFRLAYDDRGIAHATIAAELGLSLQRVRQILCEVRAKLRAAMDHTP
jgi:RNA polymerase sigma-70 factor (ECF subfamily)